jgi:hypothetical protein
VAFLAEANASGRSSQVEVVSLIRPTTYESLCDPDGGEALAPWGLSCPFYQRVTKKKKNADKLILNERDHMWS